jgi:AraC-like DNA-binding protein
MTMGRSERARDFRRSGAADPEGRQRVGVLREVPRVLQLFGADPLEVFRTAGLDPRILDNPDNEISFVAMGRLFQACVEATRCEHFGLLAGQGLNLQSLGIVGQLMRTAPNLHFALWDLALTQARNADGAVCYLRRMEHLSVHGYAIYQPGVPAIEQIIDGALALATNAIRELAGNVIVEVTFAHAEPRHIGAFRKFFGVPLLFNAEESTVVVLADALPLPVRSRDDKERGRLQELARRHLALQHPDIVAQVVRLLRPRVISGGVSLDETAAFLSLHPWSLLRRLKGRGTTFRRLLNETRYEVAGQLLRGTRLSVTQIGVALGYADTAVFTRAFRRWSGASPSDWRARHHDVVAKPSPSPSLDLMPGKQMIVRKDQATSRSR